MYMGIHRQTENEPSLLSSALPNPLDDVFHESWSCGHCGREFNDCTSCVTHEEQCGELTRW
jgi:hypothetical protein